MHKAVENLTDTGVNIKSGSNTEVYLISEILHELNLLCLGIQRGSFDMKAWVSIFLAISYQRLSFLKVGHACFFL